MPMIKIAEADALGQVIRQFCMTGRRRMRNHARKFVFRISVNCSVASLLSMGIGEGKCAFIVC
jgi:hypothetical protein